MWRRITLVCLGALALAISHQASFAQGYERRWRWEQDKWVLLGSQSVGFSGERDVIRVGREEGRYKSLVLVAKNNDVFIKRVTVEFANGERQEIRIDDMLRQGERTRAIDLEGDARVIKEIELRYRARPGFRGKALVEVYGERGRGHRRDEAVAPPPPPARDHGRHDEHRGHREQWVELGCQKVGFLKDRDSLTLPAREDRYRAIRLHVMGSGIELRHVRVHFRNGDSYEIARRQSISSGGYSDRMDLAEGRPRHIVRLDMDYQSKLSFKGEATACVEGLL
jgi:hypothetical protein